MFTGLEIDDEIILCEEDLERLGHIGSLDELRAGFDTHMKIPLVTPGLPRTDVELSAVPRTGG